MKTKQFKQLVFRVLGGPEFITVYIAFMYGIEQAKLVVKKTHLDTHSVFISAVRKNICLRNCLEKSFVCYCKFFLL